MRKKKGFLKVLVVVFFFSLVILIPRIAGSHCDTLDGSVVIDAKKALEKSDVTPVLKWVRKEDEGEIREAFKKTLSERKKYEI